LQASKKGAPEITGKLVRRLLDEIRAEKEEEKLQQKLEREEARKKRDEEDDQGLSGLLSNFSKNTND